MQNKGVYRKGCKMVKNLARANFSIVNFEVVGQIWTLLRRGSETSLGLMISGGKLITVPPPDSNIIKNKSSKTNLTKVGNPSAPPTCWDRGGWPGYPLVSWTALLQSLHIENPCMIRVQRGGHAKAYRSKSLQWRGTVLVGPRAHIGSRIIHIENHCKLRI